MEILNAVPNDFDAVLKLNEESVPHVGSIEMPQLDWFAKHAAFFRVALIDTRLAGFLIGLRPGTSYASPNYRWFCDNRSDFAYVDRVAVSQWARRRGVADSLYTEFCKSQPTAPIMTCEVNISPPNDASMRFHNQSGFAQIGTLTSEDGKKAVALMEKKL